MISQYFREAELPKNMLDEPICKTGKPLHEIISQTGQYMKEANLAYM